MITQAQSELILVGIQVAAIAGAGIARLLRIDPKDLPASESLARARLSHLIARMMRLLLRGWITFPVLLLFLLVCICLSLLPISQDIEHYFAVRRPPGSEAAPLLPRVVAVSWQPALFSALLCIGISALVVGTQLSRSTFMFALQLIISAVILFQFGSTAAKFTSTLASSKTYAVEEEAALRRAAERDKRLQQSEAEGYSQQDRARDLLDKLLPDTYEAIPNQADLLKLSDLLSGVNLLLRLWQLMPSCVVLASILIINFDRYVRGQLSKALSSPYCRALADVVSVLVFARALIHSLSQ
jgi:hypothetical protein